MLINVMFNDINRWKDDPREFLRVQMREFFGLEDGDLPERLSEEKLLGLYRQNLKERCNIRFAADLAIAHPTQDRTWFRLVVGGNHPKVLEVFRAVESNVAGEAHEVRAEAKRRAGEARTGQLGLHLAVPPRPERSYAEQNLRDLEAAREAVRESLAQHGRQRFDALWPLLLERFHITRSDLCRCLLAQDDLSIEPERRRRSRIEDEALVRASRSPR
ncbi:hypothetical protein [Haliangium ochraceum]|uniref:hypothetical protein n=1 Tax=Haliangium ochraceum TaxID=80816 RepID=UPI001269DC2E|nr:hypothetical protein [Haliangium ochraceum]